MRKGLAAGLLDNLHGKGEALPERHVADSTKGAAAIQQHIAKSGA